jgi:hypothetical protein
MSFKKEIFFFSPRLLDTVAVKDVFDHTMRLITLTDC